VGLSLHFDLSSPTCDQSAGAAGAQSPGTQFEAHAGRPSYEEQHSALSRIESQPFALVVRAPAGCVHVGLQLADSVQLEQVPPVSLHFAHATSQTFTFIPSYVTATSGSPPLIQKSSSQASVSSPQALAAHAVFASATVALFSLQWHVLSFSGLSQASNSHLSLIFVHPPVLSGLFPSLHLPKHISFMSSNAFSVKKDSAAETTGFASYIFGHVSSLLHRPVTAAALDSGNNP